MTAGRRTRLAAGALLAVALVALWQAWPLERWNFDGPGAGFFPQAVALVCVLLSLLVMVRPGRASMGVDDEAADDAAAPAPSGPDHAFAVYGAAMLVMALGTLFAGFAATAVLTTVIVMRLAERRGWWASLSFGVICALVGLVLFGRLLRVDLPQGPLDEAILALLR